MEEVRRKDDVLEDICTTREQIQRGRKCIHSGLARYHVASDDASMVNDQSAVRHTGRDLIACLDGSLSRFGTCNNINAT